MTRVLNLIIMVISLWMISCESPDDLKAVSGIQGMIEIEGVLPDSIQAVALVILDVDVVQDQDHIADHLINYSDPLDESGEYYIQLKPGTYIGVLVGLLIDPGLFVVNIDEFLNAPELPLIQLSEVTEGALLIQEGIMQEKNWTLSF
ncbi:MAG: hypothetical protein K9M49_05660 [Candidatus Marinimicrobia bacterium]|nr:hypothetical protein [Candidatus Neomarinimicrobiota bacterium]MCF7904624.1 hypothetical protein [Candidatus Neomarinimicrobiota bacterium]